MPIQCLISFDNNLQHVYYASQELSGSVELTVNTVKRIRAISITVLGFTKVRWSRNKGAFRESNHSIYQSYKQHLSSTSYVLGYRGANPKELIPGEEYSYSFHVILPGNLPTSFDGQFGHVRYEIVVTIERVLKEDRIFKKPFTVVKTLDLNIDPLYKQRLETFTRRKFWSYCCSSGPLLVQFTVPYSGYAPGQKINFSLFINNESAIDCSEAQVALKQYVTYECRTPYREARFEKITITSKKFGHILRWSRKEYKDSLDIPSIPPTATLSSNLITILYSISVIVRPPEYHRKLKMKIPITIGTIPIFDNPANIDNQEMSQLENRSTTFLSIATMNMDVAAGAASAVTSHLLDSSTTPSEMVNRRINPQTSTENRDRPPSYNIIAPPSYEEALSVRKSFIDEDSDVAQSPFAPKYPVFYNFSTPAASFDLDDAPVYNDSIYCELENKPDASAV